MKVSNLIGKAKGSALLLLGTASVVVSMDANAIPVFARQTGFKCIACHVGGAYPQLTSLGRMFKLTGYTMGNRPNFTDLEVQNDYPPVAVMVQTARQYYNNTVASSLPGHGQGVPSSAMDVQVVSFFAGGKITDNVGAFMQWTGQKYDNSQTGSQSSYQSAAIDNTEFRYADRTVTPDSDLIVGAYVNNRATMSDVWNNEGPWLSGWINYFNAGNAQAPLTFLDTESTQHTAVGAGAYVFKDKTWYGELAVYGSPTHGPLSVMTAGASPANGSGTVIDPSPYFRLAYNKEWGPHSLEVGMNGFLAYAHGLDPNQAVSSFAGPVSTYRDVGIDAQYQYILDPHFFALHGHVSREFMNNNRSFGNYAGAIAQNATDNLTETYLDGSYIYKGKYGTQLTYQAATGSNDTGLYALATNGVGAATGNPNWSSWTPSIFWAPWQNVRIGYMYTFYTEMGGVTSGNRLLLNGANFTPQNFNTSMLYATIVY